MGDEVEVETLASSPLSTPTPKPDSLGRSMAELEIESLHVTADDDGAKIFRSFPVEVCCLGDVQFLSPCLAQTSLYFATWSTAEPLALFLTRCTVLPKLMS